MAKMTRNKLVMYKELNNLTWPQLADKIGIARSALMRIVTGEVRNLKLETVEAIKKVTGLSYEEYIPRPARSMETDKKLAAARSKSR